MNYKIFIDREREEEVLIYAHERTELVERLEELLREASEELIGYREDEIVRLTGKEISCFLVEDGRTYAVTDRGRYWIKLRLYQLEERFAEGFLKINQSCIVNVKRIEGFRTSFGGALMVTLAGGYRDYVSRRQLKAVKERIGF